MRKLVKDFLEVQLYYLSWIPSIHMLINSLPEPSMAVMQNFPLQKSYWLSQQAFFHILIKLTFRHHCLVTDGRQTHWSYFIVGVTLAIHQGSGTETLKTVYAAWPAVHNFTFEFLQDFQANVIQFWWLINIQSIYLVLLQNKLSVLTNLLQIQHQEWKSPQQTRHVLLVGERSNCIPRLLTQTYIKGRRVKVS